jgi:Domain of unknown function (DUF4169)
VADIVNLKRMRKQKARLEKAVVAIESRIRFGRSKAERSLAKANESLKTRRLEGNKRDG